MPISWPMGIGSFADNNDDDEVEEVCTVFVESTEESTVLVSTGKGCICITSSEISSISSLF